MANFYFEMTGNGKILWKTNDVNVIKTIKYRKGTGGPWTNLTPTEEGAAVDFNNNDTIYFSSDNSDACANSNAKYCYFATTGDNVSFVVKGDIEELVNGSTSLPGYAFRSLFNSCTALTDASELTFPNSVSACCYQNMFQGCTSLERAPRLPATSLAEGCYREMFYGCKSLTGAPELNATVLSKHCYGSMFNGCTSLTGAPSLAAERLADECYFGMFRGCTSLTAAPALPATELAKYCYANMFQGCSSLTSAPFLPATTLVEGCYYNMFYGCTGLTAAPELNASVLSNYAYKNMFSHCTSLKEIKCLATDITSNQEVTKNWVFDVAETGDFSAATSVSWTTGPDGIPYGWNQHKEAASSELTFEITQPGNINWQKSVPSAEPRKIEYRRANDETSDYGSWTLFPDDGIYVQPSNRIQFKGSYDYYAKTGWFYYFSSTDAQFKLSGNIMSLLGPDFASKTKLDSAYTFSSLFQGCTGLTDASQLSLPATTLTNGCYKGMFSGCTRLTIAPALPATTMQPFCYNSMFASCTRLATAPSLPANVLGENCYARMFAGCTSLTEAPALTAGTMAEACYQEMFDDCTSLTTVPALTARTMAKACYQSMFAGCTGLTQAPALPATILANNCYSAMFFGCTSLTGAPELNATDLAEWCYSQMFYDCTSLTQAPELPAEMLASNCYRSMFANCTALKLGLSYDLPASNVPDNAYREMFKNSGTVNLPTFSNLSQVENYGCYEMFRECKNLKNGNRSPLGATIIGDYSYYCMFYECTDLNTAPNIGAIILGRRCCESMFNGCTRLTEAPPELPATTLAERCYAYMFKDCEKLYSPSANFIKAEVLAPHSCEYMFQNCKSLTYAPALIASRHTAPSTQDLIPYQSMFKGCTGLYKVKCLLTDMHKEYDCTYEWVKDVKDSPGYFVQSKDAEWLTGEHGIPDRWTRLIDGGISIERDNETIILPSTASSSEYPVVIECLSYQPNWLVSSDQFWFQVGKGTAVYHDTNYPQIPNTEFAVGAVEEEYEKPRRCQVTFTAMTSNNVKVNEQKCVVIQDKFEQYLTFRIKTDGKVYWKLNGDFGLNTTPSEKTQFISEAQRTIQWRKPGVSGWQQVTSSSGGTGKLVGEFHAGDIIEFSIPDYYEVFSYGGTLTNPGTTSQHYLNFYNQFVTTCEFSVEGNVMSLFKYAPEDFIQASAFTTFVGEGYNTEQWAHLKGLFEDCTGLTDASNLKLRATFLGLSTYERMFKGCTNMTGSPEIFAYYLPEGSCRNMFSGCTNLQSIKCLSKDIRPSSNTEGWVEGVPSRGTFTYLNGMEAAWDEKAADCGIPSGWATVSVEY